MNANTEKRIKKELGAFNSTIETYKIEKNMGTLYEREKYQKKQKAETIFFRTKPLTKTF